MNHLPRELGIRTFSPIHVGRVGRRYEEAGVRRSMGSVGDSFR